MRIFLLPPNGTRLDALAIRACEVLRLSLIMSARIGGIVNGQAVVLVAPHDMDQALNILKKAGIVAMAG